MDANQRWDVGEAISYMKQLAKFKPVWIEEPTSPDDVLGKWIYCVWLWCGYCLVWVEMLCVKLLWKCLATYS